MVDGLAPRDREDPAPQVGRLGPRVGAQRGKERLLKAVLGVVRPHHPAQERANGLEMLVEEHLERRERFGHREHPPKQTPRQAET